MTGWPDETRPGVPLNPEKDGWHWVRWTHDAPGAMPDVVFWTPHGPEKRGPCWLWDGDWTGPTFFFEQACYLGPCLTPSEVAAQLAAARREGAEAMRERAARVCEQGKEVPDRRYPGTTVVVDWEDMDEAAAAIRALPVEGESDASGG